MTKVEKIKRQKICCHTCNNTNCDFVCADDCLVPTYKRVAVKIIDGYKVWRSVLHYEYAFWEPDIPKDSILPERLFEI